MSARLSLALLACLVAVPASWALPAPNGHRDSTISAESVTNGVANKALTTYSEAITAADPTQAVVDPEPTDVATTTTVANVAVNNAAYNPSGTTAPLSQFITIFYPKPTGPPGAQADTIEATVHANQTVVIVQTGDGSSSTLGTVTVTPEGDEASTGVMETTISIATFTKPTTTVVAPTSTRVQQPTTAPAAETRPTETDGIPIVYPNSYTPNETAANQATGGVDNAAVVAAAISSTLPAQAAAYGGTSTADAAAAQTSGSRWGGHKGHGQQ